jgi:hypothetical protein
LLNTAALLKETMKKFSPIALLTFLGLAVSSAQNSISISGTIFARIGSSLTNTVVIGCYIVNDDCDEQGSKIAQLNSSTSSAKYTLGGLVQNREYLLLAWRDLNKSGEVDKGDELGVSQQGGKPAEVKAPASAVDVRLALFNGDFDALLDQADQPTTGQRQPATQPSTSLTLSGTVRPLVGSSLSGTTVLASVWDNGKYNQNRTKAIGADSSGKFSLSNLEKTQYVLFAWRDLDNNGDVGAIAAQKPERGWFKGVAMDRCGKRIANAEITLAQPGVSYSGVTAKTDKNGEYRMRVGNAYYDIYANFYRQVGGQSHNFCLDPDTNETQNGIDGGVVNLIFHNGKSLSALPGQDKALGGRIRVSLSDIFDRGGQFPAGSKMVLTIEPLGNMADGYPKAKFTYTITSKGEGNKYTQEYIDGVPLGSMRISAEAKQPDGSTLWYPIKTRDEAFDSNGSKSVEVSTLPERGGSVTCLGRSPGDAEAYIALTVTK